jgi:thioredoxin reductase
MGTEMMVQDVVIVGAGPYGLSVAAHLKAQGIHFRIFGKPMQTWRERMPQGMFLKSEGFASSLSDPGSTYTLKDYCAEQGIAYADVGLPVSRETFWRYGMAFQQRLVPELEETDVTGVEQAGAEFRVTLATGEVLFARQVVMAIGITHYAYLPPELSGLPSSLVSHSAAYGDLEGFAGKEVLVVGAGASAVDCAALLQRAGAKTGLVTKRDQIRFHAPPGKQPRPLLDRIRAPMSGLGPGWKSRLCTDAPLVFYAMPERFRVTVVKRHLGPAPGWWTKPMVEDKVDFHFGLKLVGAEAVGSRVALHLSDAGGNSRRIEADHVIGATGYVPDVRGVGFLDEAIRRRIKVAEHAPVLSTSFESSVPGLYFTGISAANSFGPMMRFAYGAAYTARRLARHLARSRRAFNQAATAPVGRRSASVVDA